MSQITSDQIRNKTIIHPGDSEENQYKERDGLAETDRITIAVHKEKFINIEGRMTRLESLYDKTSTKIDKIEAFKNKVLGMSLIVNLLCLVVGYFIRGWIKWPQ